MIWGISRGNKSPVAPIMIVGAGFRIAQRPTNALVALIRSEHRRAIMNFFLFVLEIFLVVAGIALVPARSELRISRTRVIHDERERGNSLCF